MENGKQKTENRKQKGELICVAFVSLLYSLCRFSFCDVQKDYLGLNVHKAMI